MIVSSHKVRRFATAAGLLAVLAVFATAAGVASARPMTADDMRAPDTKDVALGSSGLDPAISTAIAAHRPISTSVDRRSPDTLDVAIATAVAAHQITPVVVDARTPDTRDVAFAQSADLRSPDTVDAAPGGLRPVPTSPAVATDGWFDWTRFGLASGGAILLLAAAGGAMHQGRGRRSGSVTAA